MSLSDELDAIRYITTKLDKLTATGKVRVMDYVRCTMFERRDDALARPRVTTTYTAPTETCPVLDSLS